MQDIGRTVLQGMPPIHDAETFVVVEGFRVRVCIPCLRSKEVSLTPCLHAAYLAFMYARRQPCDSCQAHGLLLCRCSLKPTSSTTSTSQTASPVLLRPSSSSTLLPASSPTCKTYVEVACAVSYAFYSLIWHAITLAEQWFLVCSALCVAQPVLPFYPRSDGCCAYSSYPTPRSSSRWSSPPCETPRQCWMWVTSLSSTPAKGRQSTTVGLVPTPSSAAYPLTSS